MRYSKVMIYDESTPLIKVITNNGTPLDDICTKCITNEELSSAGNYIADLEFINDNDKARKIKNQSYIKLLMNYGTGNEYEIFQIKKVSVSLKRVTIMVYQYTIFQQKSLWLDDVRPTNLNANSALNYMLNNAAGHKNINISSNISIIDTAYYQCTSLYNALYDSDNSFINKWGSKGVETLRRGINVTMNTKIGGNRKLSIREGKNLKLFSDTKDLESYVTRGIGKAFNGIKGNYIDSPLINNYKDIHTQVFEYPHIKLKSDDMEVNPGDVVFNTLDEVKAELDRLVRLEFSQNNVDKIYASYDLDYAKLEDSVEYIENGYAKTEKANIGDYVKVEIPTLGYSLVLRVVKKQYDVLKQKTKSIKLSNYPVEGNLSSVDIVKGIQKQFNAKGLKNMNDFVTSIINKGLENSHVIVRPDEILVMDTDDINTAMNVWRWNKGALAHTNKGYYSNEWNIGITQNGSINASIMNTGVLTAILIKALEGSGSNMSIDLSTGEVYMDKGRIGNDNVYFEITQQVIKGLKTELKLAEGIYKFSDGNVIIDNDNGIVILKGKIGNDTVYFDITNQIIKGDRVTINLKDGTNNLMQAGSVGSTNGVTNINLNDGTAKIGNFSVDSDNKVQITDGSFTAKDGSKYCKVESGMISWNDGSRIKNNNEHILNGIAGLTTTIESLDIIGNTSGGVSLYSKAANAIVNVCSTSARVSYNNANQFFTSTDLWIAGDTVRNCYISGNEMLKQIDVVCDSINATGNFRVSGDKNCIQKTEKYGDIKFSSLEDIGAYLTWREYGAKYETTNKSYNDDGYYSCLVMIPDIIKSTINTEGNYNVDITVIKSFADARIWSMTKDYFIVKSDKPCKFNFVLTGRRKGFEERSLEEQVLEGERYKIIKENDLLRYKADIKLRFKRLGLKPNYPLWAKCANEWIEYGKCLDD